MANILNFAKGLLEFDRFSDPLIGKLVAHRESFITEKGDPQIHIPVLPLVIRLNAERIQDFVRKTAGRVIGLNPILYFCLLEGYLTFKENESVVVCADYRHRFRGCSTEIATEVNYEIANLLDSFKVNLPAEGKRRSIPVSPETHGNISTLSFNLGITIYSLSCLCMMNTLAQVHGTNTPDVAEMEKIVNLFLRRAETRGRLLKAAFQEFDL